MSEVYVVIGIRLEQEKAGFTVNATAYTSAYVCESAEVAVAMEEHLRVFRGKYTWQIHRCSVTSAADLARGCSVERDEEGAVAESSSEKTGESAE